MSMSEHRNSLDEEPIYRYVTRKWDLTEPTVFRSESGAFWNGSASQDLVVFNPRARIEQGRPTWLGMGGLRSPRAVGFKQLGIAVRQGKLDQPAPVLVQAFLAEESADAVPVDQIVLYPGKDVPVLMLPSGTLRIRAIDRSTRVLGQYRVTYPATESYP